MSHSPFHKKKRIAWLLLAFACMLSSAYCLFGWMGAVGRISGWIGLPEYESRVPQLEIRAKVWFALATGFPFVAALLLGFARRRGEHSRSDSPAWLTYPAESAREKWLTPTIWYFEQLLISVLGTFGCFLGLFLLGFLLYKLGIRAG